MSVLLLPTLRCWDGEGALGCGTAQKAAATEPSLILGTRWNLLVPITALSRGTTKSSTTRFLGMEGCERLGTRNWYIMHLQ
jgi:hypothetical protein